MLQCMHWCYNAFSSCWRLLQLSPAVLIRTLTRVVSSENLRMKRCAQIFGAQMRVPADILACGAAELLQPYDPARPGACSRDSPAALIHMRLLDLVSL